MSDLSYPFEVSVIVCHHKGEFIHQFINSCKKSFGVNFEILILTSDQNLADRGISGCRTFYSEGLPAKKRNEGARYSKGQYLAFFDDDVEINPDCLLSFKKFLDSDKRVGMVYGKLYNMEHRDRFDEAGGFLTWTGFIWSRAGQNDVDKGQYDHYETILAGKSASCMIREEAFFKVGGFDEDFGILGEETDLSWRVWLQGSRVCFIPEAVGYHAFNTKFKPAKEYYTSSRVHYNGCRNYSVMLFKNLGRWNLCRIMPVHIAIWFTAGIAMLITLKIKEGWNILRGLAYLLRNIRSILEKRRKVQSNRVLSDRQLLAFIYKNPRIAYYFQRFYRYLRIGLHG